MHSYTNNLTQAPQGCFHTLWRVAPKITSILFGGGRHLKKQKTPWKNKKAKKTPGNNKKTILPDSLEREGLDKSP